VNGCGLLSIIQGRIPNVLADLHFQSGNAAIRQVIQPVSAWLVRPSRETILKMVHQADKIENQNIILKSAQEIEVHPRKTYRLLIEVVQTFRKCSFQ
jgi:hypothetical protein